MKPDLKILREILDAGTNLSLETRYTRIEAWYDDFKKELQQLKQDYDKTFHCLIDEVLGDIPHVGSNPTTKGENQQ